MSKAILISIKPEWVAKILNGEKTIEIRKTMPKCDLPIDVYIYCSKGSKKNWHLFDVVDTDTGWKGYEYDYFIGSKEYLDGCLEGKVVAKFTLNKVRTSDMTNCLQGSCLSYKEVNEYTKGKKFYGWVIDNLEIFDKPKEVSEFWKQGEYCKNKESVIKREWFCEWCNRANCIGDELTKAPQSYCFIETEIK